MCRIMLGLKGGDATRKELQDYQANHLGRTGDQTLLTELVPLLAPDTIRRRHETKDHNQENQIYRLFTN